MSRAAQGAVAGGCLSATSSPRHPRRRAPRLRGGSFHLSAATDGSTDITLNSQSSGGYSVTPSSSVSNPYSAVVLISTGGTGFIIGPHTILTAAHVATDIADSTDQHIYLETNGSDLGSSISIDPNYVHIDSLWKKGLHVPQNDLAIIDVKQDLSAYGQFTLSTDFSGGTVNITGYPGSAPGLQQYNGVTSVSPVLGTLAENPEVSEHGDSGGPLWISNGTAFDAVGLVSGAISSSADLKLTSADRAEIQNWIADDASLWVSSAKDEDGYISGATVFADANGTGKLAANAVSTTTDANGNFTLTGGTGPLIAFGGTDISTGLAFKGQLESPSGSTVIDPLTTLIVGLQASAGLTVAAAEQKVLAAVGLPSGTDLTTLDPLAGAHGGDAVGARAFAAGAKVIDTADAIASAFAAAGVSFLTAFKDAYAGLESDIKALTASHSLDLAD